MSRFGNVILKSGKPLKFLLSLLKKRFKSSNDTVIAGHPAKAIVNKYCPSVDILGLNVGVCRKFVGANLESSIGISLILFPNGE